MEVCFLQRVFAHYQGGLAKALTQSTRHTYTFCGDIRDPLNSGIKPFSFDSGMNYKPSWTWHWTQRIAVQPKAVLAALDRQYDCLILEGSFTLLTNWLALLAAKLTGKRVLLYGHGWLKPDPVYKKYVRNSFYHLADGLLLYGRRAYQFGIEQGFPSEKLYVVYNSLDHDEIIAYRQPLIEERRDDTLRQELFGAFADRPLLVAIGRLTAVKRLDLLIEAARILQNKEFPVNVLIVGSGPEEEVLQKLANAYGLSIFFAGAKYDERELSVCFQSANVTVIPGAAGLSVIHSLSYGTPVITHSDFDSQMPEAEAVMPGKTGFYFEKENADSLAEAIFNSLTNLPRNESTYYRCIQVVDELYNPVKMRDVFDDAVDGFPVSWRLD